MARKKIRQGPLFKKPLKKKEKRDYIYIYIFAYELQEQFIYSGG